jgi:serine/threonine protein kinase
MIASIFSVIEKDNTKRFIKGCKGHTYTIHLNEHLGSGGFGQVFKGVDRFNKIVAVKRIDKSDVDKNAKQSTIVSRTMSFGVGNAEVDALIMFNGHPNIVQIIDYSYEDETIYIVLEFCKEGSLDDLLKQKKLTKEKVLRYLLEIAQGLKVIHDKSCMHRDLKPGNILIQDGHCKIADLGLMSRNKISKTHGGTHEYMAPEMFEKNQPYGKEVDIYALGTLFYEMLCAVDFNSWSEEIKSLNLRMINDDPQKRPSVDDIIKFLSTKDKDQKLLFKDKLRDAEREAERWESEKEAKRKLEAEREAEKRKAEEEAQKRLIAEREAERRKVERETESRLASERMLLSSGTFGGTSSTMKCFSCKGWGHYANQCPVTGGYFDPNVTCFRCRRIGHYSNQCRN